MRTCTSLALFLVSVGCYASYPTDRRDGAVPIDGGFDAGVDVGAPDAPTVRDVSLRVVHSISREPIAGAEVAFRGGDVSCGSCRVGRVVGRVVRACDRRTRDVQVRASAAPAARVRGVPQRVREPTRFEGLPRFPSVYAADSARARALLSSFA